MNTLRDHEAVIAAWLDHGPLTLPAETRQAITVGIRTVTRRRAGIAWPFAGRGLRTIEPRRLSVALSSAAVVVVAAALAVSLYVNQQGGIGALPSPTPTASPTVTALPSVEPTAPPSLLARGNFVDRDFGRVEFEATREGSSATGRMTWPEAGGSTIDLRCARTTEDGLLMIGGYITDTTIYPQGSLAAIGLDRERPTEAWISVGSLVNVPATQTTDCLAYLDAWYSFPGVNLHPINGTVEFGP